MPTREQTGAGGWSSSAGSSVTTPLRARSAKAPMSGPIPMFRVFVSLLLAGVLLVAPAHAAPTLAPTPRAGPPVALRTEIVLDRTTLENLRVPNPSQIAFDPAGNLYVLDASSRRVVKLD